MKDPTIFKPWSAQCHFKRVPAGWLFYSYSTPVGFVKTDDVFVTAYVTTRSFSRTTSAQLSKYFLSTLLGRFAGWTGPILTAYNTSKVDQSLISSIARENSLPIGKGY